MENKAAILTWCYNGEINYGQILQCYAMQKLVRRFGYEPKVIRYRKQEEKRYLIGSGKAERLDDWYELWYRLAKVEHKIDIRILRFIGFIKNNISLSKQCYTKEQVEEECKDCKVLFCGSDQIWNPLVFDDVFFLNFGSKTQKRVAFAPSGIWKENMQTEEFYEKIKEYIERFQVVSVREDESADIFKKYIKQKIQVVADPTLLLAKKEWNDVSSIQNIKEPYIFCYFLGRFRPYKTLLKKIMKSCHVNKIFFTTPGIYSEENELNRDEFFCAKNHAGPAEFLALIRDAQAVCTDSYHGLIFSVIYEKQFYIFERNTPYRHPGANMARQESVLRRVGIFSQRRIRCIRDLEKIEFIDYKKVDLEKLWLEAKKIMECVQNDT